MTNIISKTGGTCEDIKARISTCIQAVKGSVAHNFPIIVHKAENFLFKCQVSIVIGIRDMATNNYVDEHDSGVC